jgi:hypothetical protein
MLKIFRLEQDQNARINYFDSCVVASSCEEKARKIHPWNAILSDEKYQVFLRAFNLPSQSVIYWDEKLGSWISEKNESKIRVSQTGWASPDKIKVTYIGIAAGNYKEGDIICVSFNRG